MSELVVGLSHRTAPVDLLERTALDDDGARKLLADVAAADHADEALVLATCNRLEVYADVRKFHGGVQDVTDRVVADLHTTDVLFVDSSHVSKVDSDVNHVVFRVLPALPPGAWIHFHDVFFPFEYPRPWVFEGRAWNEAYLVRAFLSYNDAFRIALWPSLLAASNPDALAALVPREEQGKAASVWLEKTGGAPGNEG